MMRIFCTLFDKNYLFQGIALHNSLKSITANFKLYALCMDSAAYATMKKMESASLVPISIEELINPELSAVRGRTTHGQFCWVCQPIICQYVLDKFGVDMVTYLEADSLFFSDPEILFSELGEKSVSLVPHNYSPEFDKSDNSGRYCVQFNAFKNNSQAREVLEYWKECCFEYDKNKPSAYPGQTTLDEWPEKFDCVKVIQHRGAGIAPWNVQHVKLTIEDSVPYVDGVPMVFYHFHQYGRLRNGAHELGHYPLPKKIINSVYKRYVNDLRLAEEMVHAIEPTFLYRRQYPDELTFWGLLQTFSIQNFRGYLGVIRRRVRGRYNVFPDEYFSKSPGAGK